ncbi:MAG: hypothetical protein IJU01_06105 [Lachnospiraceae bacterium]|nr:hypothetical protein [Lachnospiraceae bacterium]
MFEETVKINGHTVKIKYSEEKHPEIVSTMRDTLERSKKVIQNPAKFDKKGHK